MKKTILIVALILGIVALYGCLAAGSGTLVLQITDAKPELNITSVLVTISDVEVHMAAPGEEENATSEAGWYMVAEGPQTFDLIEIKDANEFLGYAGLGAGKYTQIRLSVDKAVATIDGNEWDLPIPSEKVKLVHPFTIEPGQTTTLTLDFDAQESIHPAGEGQYVMRPTIKVMGE